MTQAQRKRLTLTPLSQFAPPPTRTPLEQAMLRNIGQLGTGNRKRVAETELDESERANRVPEGVSTRQHFDEAKDLTVDDDVFCATLWRQSLEDNLQERGALDEEVSLCFFAGVEEPQTELFELDVLDCFTATTVPVRGKPTQKQIRTFFSKAMNIAPRPPNNLPRVTIKKKGRREKYLGKMTVAEKERYFKAMLKEWNQVFTLGAQLLSLKDSLKIPNDRIIPSRWVLTDKYDGLDPEKIVQQQLEEGVSAKDVQYDKPKARWACGGHKDPDLGGPAEISIAPDDDDDDDDTTQRRPQPVAHTPLRTDAPTSDLLGQHLVLLIAAAKGWPLLSSDVSNAFLRGNDIDRDLYMSMPRPLPPGAQSHVWPCRGSTSVVLGLPS